MAKKIVTAAEWKKEFTKHQATAARERREFLQAKAKAEAVEDLRDDLMSAIRNSGLKYEDIHAGLGPTVSTLNNWDQKKVQQPRIGKMRAAGAVIGLDLKWVPK